jgi:Tfp pilus assembly protein PilX
MSRGSALLLTMILSLIMALCGVTLFLLSRFLLAQARWDMQKIKASFAAEAATQYVINRIVRDEEYDQSKWPCEQRVCTHTPQHNGESIQMNIGSGQSFRIITVKYMETEKKQLYRDQPYISEGGEAGKYSVVEIITEGECKRWKKRAKTYIKVVNLSS